MPFSRLENLMRATAPILVVLLGAAASLALASCGGGSDANLLPGRTAEEIESNLEEVQRMAGEGECVGARDAAQQIGVEVERLAVDAKLKRALSEGTERLDQVLASCEEASAEEVEEEPEPVTTEEEKEPPEKPAKAEKQLEKEEEREAKEAEKAEEEAEKEAEREEAEAEQEAQEAEEESEFAPPASGANGKGPEGAGPPGQGGGSSGGVGPGVATGGEG
jgi:outer membrane biosynthesis protein TonB